MLRELDQNQQIHQNGMKISMPPPHQDLQQQHYLARKIPKYRVERLVNSNNFDKENAMLDNMIKHQRQGDISKQPIQQMDLHANQIQKFNQQQQNAFQERGTFGQQEPIPSQFNSRERLNSLEQSKQDINDSMCYGQKNTSTQIVNSFSNEKLDLKGKIEKPYQIQSAEVKSCKFSNRPNSQEWFQFGNQQQAQRYDVNFEHNDNKKIVRNLNFTDSFNISQILKDSSNNFQNFAKPPQQQLNQSFQSSSSLCGSRAILTEKPPLNQQQYQQMQQHYQVPIQNSQSSGDINKKRSQSLMTQGMSTQNSLQSLGNIPQMIQKQSQMEQYYSLQQQKQLMINQKQENLSQSQQKPPTNIQSHNIHSYSGIMNSNSKVNQSQQNQITPNQMQKQQQQHIIQQQNFQQFNQQQQKNTEESNNQLQSQKGKEQQMLNSQVNLDQSMMYKSVISQINEDFISKDSMNLLIHEEEFLNQFKKKVEQEKNSMRQSYDFIMKHLYDQISIEMSKQFSLLDKEVSQFVDLFQKFKNHAIEYKNISSSVPPLSSNLKNMWNSSIMNNLNNYFQEGNNKLQNNNLYDMIDWEECLKAKAQHQQQQHQYQQVYFQQKELLLQTECISQQIYQQLQVNRSVQIKDQSLDFFLNLAEQMKPQTHQSKKNQSNHQYHLLDNQKHQQNHLKETKNNSLDRNAAVITTEFSPEKMGFRQPKNRINTESQQCSEAKSQKIISSSNFMMQSEVNSKITKLDVERWDNNQIFTQIQSRKPSIDETSMISAFKKDNKTANEEYQGETLPFDKLVQLQKVQLLKYSDSNFQEHAKGSNEANDESESHKSPQIIAEDFVERIDSYKAPYMFRDEDQIAVFESSDNIISNYLNDQGKSQQDSNQSVQQPNEKVYHKKSRKNSSRNGKQSSISNNGGASHMNQLFTDREQEFQFDDQQDQFNNTYSIQLSVSRISNQDVDQLNETINNLRLLNDSFQNNNLNETLMNLQLMNTHNNSTSNNNNNRLSLKQLLAQTNMQLAQQLNLNNQQGNNSNKNNNNNPPPPPPSKNFSKQKKQQNEIEGIKEPSYNSNQNLKTNEDEKIFSETDLLQLREQLKKNDSMDDIHVIEQDTKKIADSPAYNPLSFQRKLKNSRVNIVPINSSKALDDHNINETEREQSYNQSTQCQQKNYLPPSNNTSTGYNLPLTMQKQNQENSLHQLEINRQQISRRLSEYDSNNNSHNISIISNSQTEIPHLSSFQNIRKTNEYNSVDQGRKGNPSENDSQRSIQSTKGKDSQNSSLCGNSSEGQSHTSIITSKRRFESSLTRPVTNANYNSNNQSSTQPSYNIEFEGYVKQKQNPNDSFSRSSFRLNSQQSCRGEKQNSVSSPRNTFSQMEDDNQKLQDFHPSCGDGYQFIKRDMKSIDIFKPKTYSLFDGENAHFDSKEQQVISCLWVRENLYAFATNDNTLMIYDTSKADSDKQQDKSQCLKKFSSKVPIDKMVRVNESIIALSSKNSKNIKLFDVDKFEVSLQLIGHNENITDMTFIQPSVLISASTDGCMIVWQDFVITHKKQNKNELKLIQATNDQSRLICIDSANQILVYQLLFNENKNRLCEIRNEKIIKTSSKISSINAQFSSNNILACGTNEGIIRLYDIDSENVLKIIKVCLTPIQNLLLVEHPIQNYTNINYILIVGSESDDDLVTYSKLSNSNDIISTNSKYRVSATLQSNNYSTFFIKNPTSNNLQLFTLNQSTSQFSLWNLKCT